MRVFVGMAHYDPEGRVAPHVRRHVRALGEVAERVVFVTTADLADEDAAWVSAHAQLVRRQNYGYDFFSYRTALLEHDVSGYDHVVLCNDSFVGPFVEYAKIFATMDARDCDFWGLTRSRRVAPHVQSFFVCFRKWVVTSQAFRHFWERMTPLSRRADVIVRYEVGLTRALEEAGFVGGGYYNETREDARLARRRMIWRAWLHARKERRGRRRSRFEQRRREPWNPSTALADRALGAATLPVVKIDTLRYDPYALGAQRLLDACMQQRPDLFADIPAYLERTAPYYPPRPEETLPSAGPAAPLYPLVRYV